MKELLISQIAPILATAITAILCVVIREVGKEGLQLISVKKKEIDLNIKNSGHEADIKNALEVWGIVDEKFRITENALEIFNSKENLFEKLLLERIPGLNQKDIDNLRDTVAGIVNKGREVVTKTPEEQQIANLQQDKAKLETENANLKTTIIQINSAIQPITSTNAADTQQ